MNKMKKNIRDEVCHPMFCIKDMIFFRNWKDRYMKLIFYIDIWRIYYS